MQTKRKSGKNTRRPAWIKKEILDKVRHKTKTCRGCKKGHALWEEYKETIQDYRDQVRKAKTLMKLNLASDGNKKIF